MEKGNHIIVDFYGVPDTIFDDLLSNRYDEFHIAVQDIIKRNGMTLIDYVYNDFVKPKGAFTSLYLLSESHLSFHTWPEDNYIAIDVFTCGPCKIEEMVKDLETILIPDKVNKVKIKRGLRDGFS